MKRNNKKAEKKKKKQAKKQAKKAERAAVLDKRPIKIKVVSVSSKNEDMRRDFQEVMERDVDRIEDIFWSRLPGWREAVTIHVRRKRKLSRQSITHLENRSHSYFSDAVEEVFFESYPQYKAFNYSIDVYSVIDIKKVSIKLLHFGVELNVLKTRSTDRGTIHMLPRVKFPANKSFGITTHAIERMDTRFLDLHGDSRPLGGILRCPLVFVPYKDNIYGMYMCDPPFTGSLYNGKLAAAYGLLGYLIIEEHENHFVGVTHLAPGFNKTPEYGVHKDEISNYKLLTVVDGVVHRVVVDGANHRNYDTVPYELDHQNIHFLRGFDKFSTTKEFRKMFKDE